LIFFLFMILIATLCPLTSLNATKQYEFIFAYV